MQKLCGCGCGLFTKPYAATSVNHGRVKGQPARYIHGHNGRRPLSERLAAGARLNTATDCLEWQGALTNKGYGWLRGDAGSVLAHRAVWEGAYGPAPDGLFVLHRCDNRRCILLAHLFLGTNADNVADMVAKDRHARGERNGHAKLNDEVVRALRDGKLTKAAVRRLCGVSAHTVRDAASGRSWKHV